MISIGFPSGLLLISAAGYCVICGALGARALHPAMLIGLSWAAGAGTLSVVLMLASLAGWPPSPGLLCLMASGIAGALLLLAWRGRLARLAPSTDREPTALGAVLTVASLALITAAVTNVWCKSRVPGLADVDAFAIWLLKANVVASQPLRPVPQWLTDPTLSFSHQDYPLGVPLLIAGVHAATGWSIESCAKSLLLPTFLGLICVMFGALRSLLNRPLALSLTAVFVSGRVLVSLAGSPVPELPLLLEHTAALTMLLLWMLHGERGWLMAAGAFAAFAAFTKNEGLAVWPIIGLLAVGFAVAGRSVRALADCAWAALASLLILSPWLIYRRCLPFTHEDYGRRLSHLASTIGSGRPSLIAHGFLTQPLHVEAIGGIWLLLLMCAVMGRRAWRQPVVIALWMLMLAHITLFALVLAVTPWDLPTLLPMVAPKLMMHVSPTAVLLIALHMQSIGGLPHAGFSFVTSPTKTPS